MIIDNCYAIRLKIENGSSANYSYILDKISNIYNPQFFNFTILRPTLYYENCNGENIFRINDNARGGTISTTERNYLFDTKGNYLHVPNMDINDQLVKTKSYRTINNATKLFPNGYCQAGNKSLKQSYLFKTLYNLPGWEDLLIETERN